MTTWDHRVMRHVHDGEETFQIHEVYYDDDGNPVLYTAEPVGAVGETLGVLAQEIDRFKAALSQPVLTPADFPAVING